MRRIQQLLMSAILVLSASTAIAATDTQENVMGRFHALSQVPSAEIETMNIFSDKQLDRIVGGYTPNPIEPPKIWPFPWPGPNPIDPPKLWPFPWPVPNPSCPVCGGPKLPEIQGSKFAKNSGVQIGIEVGNPPFIGEPKVMKGLSFRR